MESSRYPLASKPAGRTVSLLARHWNWLETQPRSTSATLRRLIDVARQDRAGHFEHAAARERCYLLMRDLAGDGPGFEEACRALYASDAVRFTALLSGWPEAVRHPIEALAVRVWPVPVDGSEQS